MAALMGGLASFCSCEVIPFIAALLSLGTLISGVMAFWSASPLLDPATLMITAVELGWPFAIATAILAVAVDPRFLRANLSGPFGWHQRDALSFKTEFTTNALFLIKWSITADVLAALMLSYVPSEFIARVLGLEGFLQVVTAAVIDMLAHPNGYVAPPMLAGLMTLGMGAGPALAFMIAGSISCIPAVATVRCLAKPQVSAAYIGPGLSGAITAG